MKRDRIQRKEELVSGFTLSWDVSSKSGSIGQLFSYQL